jgi:TRAP-type C4-dicarboxylate transport system permease small subunit
MYAAIDRLLAPIEKLLVSAAAIALAVIMLVISADATCRYLFNSPFSWTVELVGRYLMVFAFFAVISRAYTHNAHVRVDFLLHAIGPRWRHGLEALGALAAAVVFVLIAYLAAVRAGTSFSRGEILAGVIPWPVWPSSALVFLGAGLLSVRLIADGLAHAWSVATGTPGPALPYEKEPH